jgi:lactoylglutathione lyase
MLKKLTPNLIVEDVNKSIEFYRDTLGCFELISTDPKKGKHEWAMMRCEDVEIMFQSRASLVEKIPEFQTRENGGMLIIYIEVEGIEVLYDWVKNRVKVIKELHDTAYKMREFLIQDCDGFIITFAELR